LTTPTCASFGWVWTRKSVHETEREDGETHRRRGFVGFYFFQVEILDEIYGRCWLDEV
jgi:hypothetical protein